MVPNRKYLKRVQKWWWEGKIKDLNSFRWVLRIPYSNNGNCCFLEPSYDLSLAIGSVKVVLVAVLLALVLFTILIVDFTLCRRKKGLLYTLCYCCNKNNDMGNICQHYTQRNPNQMTV